MNKMKISIISILIFLGTQTYGQEFIFNIHNSTLDSCLKIEDTIGSELVPTSRNHISSRGEAQPIKFQRLEDSIPNLIVYYKFRELDSTLTSILYEWDVSNFEKQDNNQKSNEFQKAVIEKYKKLKKVIAKEYGEPKVKRNYSNISRLDSINTFVENSTWNPNDTTEIEMYATVSNYYEKKGAMTINPVHRIRLYVRNEEAKKEPPALDKQRQRELEALSIKFLKSIKNSEFDQSKEILANSIRSQATEEVLKQISNSIGDIDDFELSATGIQLGLDGSQYAILNYSRIKDMKNKIVGNFKVIFNNENEIVSVK